MFFSNVLTIVVDFFAKFLMPNDYVTARFFFAFVLCFINLFLNKTVRKSIFSVPELSIHEKKQLKLLYVAEKRIYIR